MLTSRPGTFAEMLMQFDNLTIVARESLLFYSFHDFRIMSNLIIKVYDILGDLLRFERNSDVESKEKFTRQ